MAGKALMGLQSSTPFRKMAMIGATKYSQRGAGCAAEADAMETAFDVLVVGGGAAGWRRSRAGVRGRRGRYRGSKQYLPAHM